MKFSRGKGVRTMFLKRSWARHVQLIAVVSIALIALSAECSALESFETVLGPTPITDATKYAVKGKGAATAVLDGNKLKVLGAFSGLATPATDAHLMMGSGIAIPGAPVLELVISPSASGTINGLLTLSRDQIAALHAGRIYIQINSQKAGPPTGNLWGWLLPEHEKADQDEPQLGHWFLPQGDGLKSHPSDRNS